MLSYSKISVRNLKMELAEDQTLASLRVQAFKLKPVKANNVRTGWLHLSSWRLTGITYTSLNFAG